MFTVATAKKQPGGMVLPAIRGVIRDIKPIEEKTSQDGSPTTVQSFTLADENGKDWMFGGAWGRADLSEWEGQVVVFASVKSGNGRFSGVSLKEKPNPKNPQFPYKNIQIGGNAALHTPDTYAASNPQVAAAPAPAAPRPQPTPQAGQSRPQAAPNPATAMINGQTVGMAIKAAVDLWPLYKEGSDVNFTTFVYNTASDIIRISQKLEKGTLSAVSALTPTPQAQPAPRPQPTPSPRAPAPQPGPEGSAFDPTEQDGDFDPPF